MSDDGFPDPFAVWRDALQQLQKNFNQFANQHMQSEDFVKVAGPLTNSTAAAKRIASDVANRYFEAIGLPTRADFQALDDRLQKIEDLLVNLTIALNQGAAPTGDIPKPPGRVPSRNRKPLAAPEAPPTPPPASSAGRSRKGTTK